jgi:uncharacterized OB-fold protein
VSLTTEPVPSRPTRPDRSPAGGRCAQCGSGLAPDQEWCLGCGSARTLIHRAPDWRVPVAIVATLLVLVVAGFAIAIIELSREANRSEALQATQTTTVAIPSTPAAAPAAAAATPKRLSR